MTRSFAFTEPGTHFAVLPAIVQRDETAGTPYARVRSIGRVRVVVA